MQEITHQDQNCDLKLSEKVLELDTDSLLRTLWIYFVTVGENYTYSYYRIYFVRNVLYTSLFFNSTFSNFISVGAF